MTALSAGPDMVRSEAHRQQQAVLREAAAKNVCLSGRLSSPRIERFPIGCMGIKVMGSTWPKRFRAVTIRADGYMIDRQ